MTYIKNSTIHGHKADYKPIVGDMDDRYAQIEANRPYVVTTVRPGHWKPESALALGRKLGIVGPVEVTYSTADMSGKGRGGYDKKFTVDENGVTDVPLSDYERYYDDADDINDLYDEFEDR